MDVLPHSLETRQDFLGTMILTRTNRSNTRHLIYLLNNDTRFYVFLAIQVLGVLKFKGRKPGGKDEIGR